MTAHATTSSLDTEVLIIGSGAGGATTAAKLAAAGRTVMVVEEGPWIDPDAVEPFSLEEMVLKYRHRGSCGTLGAPPVAYAEGRCIAGARRSTPDSGTACRRTCPTNGGRPIRSTSSPTTCSTDTPRRSSKRKACRYCPRRRRSPRPHSSGAPRSSAGAPSSFRASFKYDDRGRGVKQTMARTMIPRALADGATITADCRVLKLLRSGDHVTGALCERRNPDGVSERVVINADHVFVCGGAIQTPALLQRSGVRGQAGTA